MKITLDIPDPEKARLFLEYFVPNLPFISEAAMEEEEQIGYEAEELLAIIEQFPSDQKWTYSLIEQHLPNDLALKVEILSSKLNIMPAPTPLHQIISDELTFQLNVFVRNKKLGQVITAPIDVVFDEGNVVQPDLIFVSVSNTKAIGDRNITQAPDIVVEIWSVGNSLKIRKIKKELYEKSGVIEFWQIDPQEKTALVEVLNSEGKYEVFSKAIQQGNIKSKFLDGFEIALESLWS